MTLSRRSHEEDRAERLLQWKDAFTELRSLPEDERSAVQTLFSGSIASNPPPTRVAVQGVLEETPTFDSDEMEPALDRITSLIDDLSNLRIAYEARSTAPSTRAKSDDINQALQHVSELERLYETVPEPLRVKDVYRSPPEEEETSVLDEKLEEVIPEEAFRESKRQRMMTEEEGAIINSILGLGVLDNSVSSASGSQGDVDGHQMVESRLEPEDQGAVSDQVIVNRPKRPGSQAQMADVDGHDVPASLDQHLTAELDESSPPYPRLDDNFELDSISMDPMDRLDRLIRIAPEVKQSYERALAMPSPSDHDACMELVTRMGVPVIKAGIPYEAEGLAASMARSGLVDFVGTEDSDVLAYEVSLPILQPPRSDTDMCVGTTIAKRVELK